MVDINSIIVAALAPLNIPVRHMQYDGKASAYAIFNIFKASDSDFADDENHAEISYVSLNYYYTQPNEDFKAKEIKQLMKQAGFFFDGGQDLFSNGTFGKNLDFIYKDYL